MLSMYHFLFHHLSVSHSHQIVLLLFGICIGDLFLYFFQFTLHYIEPLVFDERARPSFFFSFKKTIHSNICLNTIVTCVLLFILLPDSVHLSEHAICEFFRIACFCIDVICIVCLSTASVSLRKWPMPEFLQCRTYLSVIYTLVLLEIIPFDAHFEVAHLSCIAFFFVKIFERIHFVIEPELILEWTQRQQTTHSLLRRLKCIELDMIWHLHWSALRFFQKISKQILYYCWLILTISHD